MPLPALLFRKNTGEKMKKTKTIERVLNWIRTKRGVDTGERETREGEVKYLTVANTIEKKLTDYAPRMTMPKGQQDLVDWKALEPRPVTKPDVYTGLLNAPEVGE
jgi:hypothetical protein